jgi:hypothetical protein
MAKLTFDEALERINDERALSAADVRADALRRKLWIAEWHMPGCLSESRSYCLTKSGAIESACMFAETEEGIPRGMVRALRASGRFDGHSPIYGDVVTTIERVKLADIL